MRSKIVLGVLAVVIVAALGVVAFTFGPKIWETLVKSDKGAQSSDQIDDHDEHEGHDHGEGESGSDLGMSLEEILTAQCEHDIAAHQCSSCRYEVGVVKLDKVLFGDSESGTSPLVKVEKVTNKKVRHTIQVTGEVQLNQNRAAHISPRIPGVIHTVHVDIGSSVKKDDVLFEIDSVQLGQAVSDFEKSRAFVALSKKNYDREKSLFERKVSSEQSLIAAEMVYEQHQAELNSATHKLSVLGLSKEEISKVDINSPTSLAGRLQVRAPFSGTITDKHAVVGELVEPGKDVILLADLTSVWVWGNIYTQDLATLLKKRKEGPIPVEVSLAEFPDKLFSGQFDYVGVTMDEKTRTVKVRATVKNDGLLLRPGMFTQIRIILTTQEQVLSVPGGAVLTDEGTDFVFKHLKEDYYVRRRVQKGRNFNGRVEIIAGLEPDDTIIADGAFLLKSDVLREKMGAGCAD